MITPIKYDQLGKASHGWLEARHHFSFANYYNPKRMGFGVLRVINDDIIASGTGFAKHPHQDMEIITYVRSGAISHKDNQGNTGKTSAGNVQVMSAGTGIFHSEYNHETTDTNLYQIWIEPAEKSVTPRWDQREFPQETVRNHLPLLVSGQPNSEDKDTLFIHQDAEIYGGRLTSGTKINHHLKRNGYLLVSEGELTINNIKLQQGDGAEITDETDLVFVAKSDVEIVLLDIPAT